MTWRQRLLGCVAACFVVAAYVVETVAHRAWNPEPECALGVTEETWAAWYDQGDPEWQS